MFNFLNNSKPWMAVSLFAATSVFGQSSCEPCCEPHQLLQCPTVAAYNAPGRIDIQCGWDIWGDASFIYWQAIQENMEPVVSHVPGITTTLGTNSLGFTNLDFQYKPGFKVGLGMSFDYDNWETSLEYTRLHGTHHKSAAMSVAAALAGDGYFPLWEDGAMSANFALYPSNVNAFSAKWRLNLDFLDADLGRWYYVGTQLTFRPSVGMRAAWIKQHRSASYTNVLDSSFAMYDLEKSNSWAVGPRFCLNMNWMIGDGFRLFGNNSFDLLFTRYIRTMHERNVLANTNALTLFKREGKMNELRAHLDLELGAGWGTYFNCHKWHFDLSASYGFQVFWNQNMFTYNVSRLVNAGNLYVHGLTLTAKVDF